MKINWLIFYCLLCCCSVLSAQDAGLQKTVSLQYEEVRLGKALNEISRDYDVYFSYSKDFIPLNKRVTAKVANQPLSFALDELFATTPIIYAAIGNQIVLRVSNTKIIRKETPEFTGSLDAKPGPTPKPVYTSSPIPLEIRSEPIRPTPMLRTPSLEPVNWPEDFPQPDKEVLLVKPMEFKDRDPYSRWGQLSVMPQVGTNLGRSEDITNNVSVNVLWGRNGGVNGVEVGGLVNSIEGDVNGLQIAGLANLVKGDLNGSSLTKNKRAKAGLQISGITNVAANVRGGQLTGCVNRVDEGDLKGFQVAGLVNTVEGNAEGWQLAGLYNSNGGNAGFQLAGLANVAGNVEKGQIAGLVNMAKEVKGFQIGLVNFADTVAGVPIGLLNFVKHGYNRLEISKSESFKASVAMRFGAYRFYNIIEIGVPKDGRISQLFSQEPTWGLGYGIGTSVGRKKMTWQMEALVQQVNEGEVWSKQLNLLTQLRLTANWQLCKHLSLFGGPTINIFVTNKYDSDLQQFDSQLLRESTFLDDTLDGIRPKKVQGWVGYKVGLRF